MTISYGFLAAAVGVMVTLAGTVSANDTLRRDGLIFFGQLPVPAPTTKPDPVWDLGRRLYWDTSISINGTVSCGSCHPASNWGADPRPYSIEAKGTPSVRHTPTVFNATLQPALRWLGDRATAAQQAEGSLTGSLGFPDRNTALARMRDLGYEPSFKAAFQGDPTPFSTKNYGAAIAQYEKTLVTPGPFDQFLAGDDTALTPEQKAGMRAFIDIGCSSCHAGPLLGGTEFRKFGITSNYWDLTRSVTRDPGRFSVTGKPADRYVFRVPMLRNVARTAPYFHDGSVTGLGRAVRIMAEAQLGTTLSDRTARSIVAFLNALTGPVPSHYVAPGSLHAAAR